MPLGSVPGRLAAVDLVPYPADERLHFGDGPADDEIEAAADLLGPAVYGTDVVQARSADHLVDDAYFLADRVDQREPRLREEYG